MKTDTLRMRGEKPFVFTNLKAGGGVEEVIRFVRDAGMLDKVFKVN